MMMFLIFSEEYEKPLDPDGFSTRWYKDMIWGTKNPWGLAAKNSLFIAFFATIGSVLIGTLAAVGLSSRHMPYKGIIMAILISPMIVPLIISGVAIFLFYGESWFGSNSYRNYFSSHNTRNPICSNYSDSNPFRF